MATEHIFKIPVFGNIILLILVSLMAVGIPSLVKGIRTSAGPGAFIGFSVLGLILIGLIAVIFSLKNATVKIDDKNIQFSSGFRTASLPIDKIQQSEIIDQSKFPSIDFRLWGFAFGDSKGGIFRLTNGKKAYIAGTADQYWAVQLPDADLYVALNKGNPDLLDFATKFVAGIASKD